MKILKRLVQIQEWRLVGLARASRHQNTMVHFKTLHVDCIFQYKASRTKVEQIISCPSKVRPLKDSFLGWFRPTKRIWEVLWLINKYLTVQLKAQSLMNKWLINRLSLATIQWFLKTLANLPKGLKDSRIRHRLGSVCRCLSIRNVHSSIRLRCNS